MLIGVVKEVKNEEHRVGLTPESVHELRAHGHEIVIETEAGAGIGAHDDAYLAWGARITANADEVFGEAEMIVKVKEPQPEEIAKLRQGQILFTYLHLAADAGLTDALIRSEATCIAYETVTSPKGGLPLLAPMSRVAGRMAPQAAAMCLQKNNGGCGKLFSGGLGVEPARVLIIGAGVAGINAALISHGMGAEIVVIDKSLDALDRTGQAIGLETKTVYSNRMNVERHVAEADVVIGCVLVPGAAAPRVVDTEMISSMRKGSVLVDVAIDQGGCFATSKATTHTHPTYEIDGIIHYCVANIPGAVPHTSTYALNHATIPYTLELADKGWRNAMTSNRHLRTGLSVVAGQLTCPQAGQSLDMPFITPEEALNIH